MTRVRYLRRVLYVRTCVAKGATFIVSC